MALPATSPGRLMSPWTDAEVSAVEPVLDDDLDRGLGRHLEAGHEGVAGTQVLEPLGEVGLGPVRQTHEHTAAVDQAAVFPTQNPRDRRPRGPRGGHGRDRRWRPDQPSSVPEVGASVRAYRIEDAHLAPRPGADRHEGAAREAERSDGLRKVPLESELIPAVRVSHADLNDVIRNPAMASCGLASGVTSIETSPFPRVPATEGSIGLSARNPQRSGHASRLEEGLVLPRHARRSGTSTGW